MNENDTQDTKSVFRNVPGVFMKPLGVGLVLLLGLMTVLLCPYQTDRIQREKEDPQQSGAKTHTGTSGQEEGRSPESEEGSENPSASPFRVNRSRDGRYTFYLSEQLEHVKSGHRVNVSLHWQDQSLDRFDKRVTVHPKKGIQLEWTPGGPQEQIPPGVYRIRISGSDLLRKPLVLSRLSEYLSNEESKQSSVLMISDTEALEYAVSVGTRQDLVTFYKRNLCELTERGRSLISAWKSWLKFARSSYEGDRDKARIAKELFDRFMRVNDAVQNLRGWIEEQEGRYALLPYRNLRGELLKLSYVLAKKVNALSMTVLRQVGVSPLSWPRAYVQRGFGQNINVLRHMSQYDRETIKDVETAIDNARLSLPYHDLTSYALYRLKEVVQYLHQFQKFTSHPYQSILDFHLSGNTDMEGYRFQSLHKYVKNVIRMRKKPLNELLSQMKPEPIRTSFEEALGLLPAYADVTFRELAKSLDLNPSWGSSGMDEHADASVRSIRGRIEEAIRRIESSEHLRQDVDISCR